MKKILIPAMGALVALAACGGAAAKNAAPTTPAPTTQAPQSTPPPTLTTQAPSCSANKKLQPLPGVSGAYECVPKVTTPPTTAKPVPPKPKPKPAPTTTTAPKLTPGQQADANEVLWIADLVSLRRDKVIEAVEADGVTKVQKFDVVVTGALNYVTLSVDTGFVTSSYQQDAVWGLAENLSALWNAPDSTDVNSFYNPAGTLHVGLQIKAHGHTYNSSYDTMVKLSLRQVDETEWLQTV